MKKLKWTTYKKFDLFHCVLQPVMWIRMDLHSFVSVDPDPEVYNKGKAEFNQPILVFFSYEIIVFKSNLNM